MINATKDTQEVLMHVKYPKMVDESFELETGPGWSRIIDETTAEIYSAVINRRRQRALAIRYNRALARALAGDVAGLEHYFRQHYYRRGLATEKIIEHKITQSLINAEYETVPEPYVYPHLVQVKEKFGDLRYYVDRLDDDLYPLVGLAERLCRYTCELCGSPGTKRENLRWLSVLCDHHTEIAESRNRAERNEMQAKETI